MQTNTVINGDCLEVLRAMPDACVHAVVTDPPYGLSKEPDMREVLRHWLDGDDYKHKGSGFMGRSWDSFVPGPKIWEEVMRVLKPGGHIFSFSGTRTYDLMVTAMRIAGAEVRDKIDVHCDFSSYVSYMYGSGFPKSLSVSKALDKKNDDEAKKWEGYGTALKPASEPIAVFSKGEDTEPPQSPDGTEFYYTAKTPKKERNAGCEDLYWCDGTPIDKPTYETMLAENESHKGDKEFKAHKLAQGNVHPTVKPLKLCRYLVKMVMPPERGLIIDPFCGSGSILCAAVLEGHDYIGIDIEESSCQIARARVLHHSGEELESTELPKRKIPKRAMPNKIAKKILRSF